MGVLGLIMKSVMTIRNRSRYGPLRYLSYARTLCAFSHPTLASGFCVWA